MIQLITSVAIKMKGQWLYDNLLFRDFDTVE